ncbi:hypothetical protein D7030_03595 [Flavobacteriaceae bacterium AU392]|nr:hypothetical protein D1817_10070 [Flavobacteriaceae bacterium]RKM85761.1 hypothetical protein D7030_03595 [Flavobacteriaceae bacterium AU392]
MNYKLFLLFYFFIIGVYAQNDHKYFGAIKISDTSFISYKIIFQENKGNIEGYSITDLGGEHETKSEISGSYDEKDRTLNFSEKGIVYTKSPITQDDFCFIHFKSNAFNLEKSKLLEGSFEGLFSDKQKCIDGEIKMTLAEKIIKRTEKITKKINRSKRISDSLKEKINPIKLLDTLNMNMLRKNETLSVFTKSEKVNLIIYDGGQEDGDKVSIFINDKLILRNYEIINSEKIIPIVIDGKKATIKIVAQNNGSISPNTMVVKIKEQERIIDVLSNLKKGEEAKIDLLSRTFK